MRHAVIGIVGQSEYGKTYLTRKIVRRVNRLIIIDPKAEFNKGVFVKEDISEIVDGMVKEKFRLAAQFESIEDYELLFIALKEFENYTLVIDETSLFCSAYYCNEDIRQIVQIIGSKQSINIVWNAQRPANISRDISSQSHVVISFRVLESADSKYFSSHWRSGAGEKELADLQVGEYRIVRGDKETLNIAMKRILST